MINKIRNFLNCRSKERFGPLPGTDVVCKQFVNGLRIFYEDLIYRFDEDRKLLEYTGTPDNEITELDLDNLPSMKMSEIVDLFTNEVSNDPLLSSNTKRGLLTGCYELEFGYYDLNTAQSELEGRNFTKAWRISSKNDSFIQEYINDTTSEIIWYGNGINVDS